MYIASTFNMPEQGDQPVASDLRAAFEDVFLQHRVSTTWNAHVCKLVLNCCISYVQACKLHCAWFMHNQTRCDVRAVVAGDHRQGYIHRTCWHAHIVRSFSKHFYFLLPACLPTMQVDLTLHGHHHSYQRSCPVIDNRCQDTQQAAQTQYSSSSGHDARGFSSISGSRSSKPDAWSFSSRRLQGGPTRVIHDAPAPVHLVIGHAGAELSLNVDLNPPDIWEVSYTP
jgi:hypothetical protein